MFDVESIHQIPPESIALATDLVGIKNAACHRGHDPGAMMRVDCTIKASKEAREQKGQSIMDLMIATHTFHWGRLHVVIGW